MRCLVGQVGRDIGAAAGAAAHIALGGQALIRQHHGLAGDAHFLRQRPGRRQATSGGQRAAEDAVAEM